MKLISSLFLTIVSTLLIQAKTISLENGAITFEVPDQFTPLTPNEIKMKYPSVHAPHFVVGNANRSVTIAYNLKDAGMPPEKVVDNELPNAQKAFTHTFNRIVPGIRWIKNEIITQNGKKFIYLELTSNAIDQDIHNIILITFFQKQMFMINFNATKAEFKTIGSTLQNCASSLVIKD